MYVLTSACFTDATKKVYLSTKTSVAAGKVQSVELLGCRHVLGGFVFRFLARANVFFFPYQLSGPPDFCPTKIGDYLPEDKYSHYE